MLQWKKTAPPRGSTQCTRSSPAASASSTRSGSAPFCPLTEAWFRRPSLWLPLMTWRHPFSCVHSSTATKHDAKSG